ncbi:MAG: tetratricopeptide repeat protein [Leadbetterella sp.]
MIKSLYVSFFILTSQYVSAQFLNDDGAKEKVQLGLGYLYNLEFKKAKETFAPIYQKYRNHPLSHLLKATEIHYENYPLNQKTSFLNRHIDELNLCVKTANLLHKNKKFQLEATFYLLASHGLLARSYDHKGETFTAALEAKKVYNYYEESKKYKLESNEFYFISGIYNFYREKYPADHPVVKPVVLFFEKGNIQLGLKELELAAKNSIFSKVEAANFLIHIYLKYQSNFSRAASYSQNLNSTYPNNRIFLIKNIECLLFTNEFDKAAKLNFKLGTNSDDQNQLYYYTFEGYRLQHQTKNLALALQNYTDAIKRKDDSPFKKPYYAMAYLGIGQIYISQKKYDLAKKALKSCLTFVEYNWMKKNAEDLLAKL